MKGKGIGRLTLVLSLSLVIVATLALAVGSGSAAAGVGNSGVPVRCFKPGASIAPAGQSFLNCIASDGTPFAEGQRVPTGYYLLVMDVLITPDAGTAMAGITDLDIYDAYGTSNRQSSFRLRSNEAASFGFKWSAPYFVMPAGHRLEVTSAAFSDFGAEVRVSGLLVTNLDFLPAILSN